MRRIGLLSWIALLAGCGCTQVGCANAIRYDPSIDLERDTVYDVEACIDGDCQQGSFEVVGPGTERGDVDGALALWADEDHVDLALGEADFSGSHSVSFTLRDAAGEVLAQFDDTIELTKSEPNGGWPCGPTCWSADIGP
jgi:hypothetical protein